MRPPSLRLEVRVGRNLTKPLYAFLAVLDPSPWKDPRSLPKPDARSNRH